MTGRSYDSDYGDLARWHALQQRHARKRRLHILWRNVTLAVGLLLTSGAVLATYALWLYAWERDERYLVVTLALVVAAMFGLAILYRREQR